MKFIQVCSAASAVMLLCISPAFPATGNPEGKAIQNIDAILSDIEALDKVDVRDKIDESKVKGPDGKKEGRIQAADATDVKAVEHWRADGSPYGLSFVGEGLIRIDLPKQELKKDAIDKGVVFISFSVRPALAEDANQLSYLNVGGAMLAFGREPPTMGVHAGSAFFLNGDAKTALREDWIDTGVSYPVNEKHETKRPLDYMVRLDPGRGEWDLFYDQELKFAGIKFKKASSSLWIKSEGEGETQISELRASVDNPLFEDQDVDGIDDVLERELGFSDRENDRHAVDEFGSFSNIEHFVNQRRRYPSRAIEEIETTLNRAIALEEMGERDEDLEELKIPDQVRRRRFAKEELDRERNEQQAKGRHFGRRMDDLSEEKGGQDL